jgi:hypothetical protein
MKTTQRLKNALTLLPLLTLGGSAFGWQEQAVTALTPVGADAVRLLRTLRDPDSAGPGPVAREVSALGTGTLDVLFSTLEERRLPDPADALGEYQILSEFQQAAVLGALEGLGRASVFPRWEERYAGPLEASSRSAAMLTLGAVGEARDLELLWQLASRRVDDDGEAQELPELSRAELRDLEASLTSLLRRDPGGFSLLEDSWSELPEEWLDELIRAAGKTGDARCIELFAQMFTWVPEQQRLIAAQLPLVGPSDDPDSNGDLAEGLLGLLQDGSKEDVQAAALALGQLEDPRAVPDLVGLLADPRPGVAGNAHAALVGLTAKSLGANTQLWSRWLQEEQRWLERERTTTVGRLRSREEHVLLAALRELSRHHLDRHELARDVASSLFSEYESVRLMAAQVLSELDSRWSAEQLILGLSDSSEAVQTACHTALVQITGLRFGMDPSEWADLRLPEPSY